MTSNILKKYTLMGFLLVLVYLLPLPLISAQTLVDFEHEIQKRRQAFKSHPLLYYLKPAGYLALENAIKGIKPDCRLKNNLKASRCVQQRQHVVETLTNLGFTDISERHFKDPNFYQLIVDLKRAFGLRTGYYRKQSIEQPLMQRRAYKEANAKLLRKSLSLNSMLLQGKTNKGSCSGQCR